MDEHRLTLGSLFDGSGGFPLGGLLAGIVPVWASEIEPFPIRVTTKRLPMMKHYGDVSRLSGAELEPVDIITFGSPCTDLSIAGRRAGLEGEHSVLFYEAVRIIKEMRCATNGRYPKYLCWENVPGAFSSNAGSDFKAVLEAVIGIVEPGAKVPPPGRSGWPTADIYLGGGWSVAYRTLDAQYWGVPQRRRRIYLVADLGGERAGEILFNSEGVSGYSAKSFRAWQGAARRVEAGSGASGVCLNDQGGARMDVSEDVSGTLRAEDHGHAPCVVESAGFCTEHSAQSRSIGYEEERSPTLRAGNVPAAFALENHAIDGRIKVEPDNTVQTLTSRMGTGGMNVPLLLKMRCGCEGGGKGPLIQENKSATLATNNDQTLFEPVCFGIGSANSAGMLSDNPRAGFYEAGTARTLDATGGNPSCNQGGIAVVHPSAYGIDRAAFNQGRNAQYKPGVDEEIEPTLTAKGPGAVSHPVYSSSKSDYHAEINEDVAGTLIASDYKDPPTVSEEPYYIIRRLTPTECARLQGFPDWWCSGLGTEDPTDEELRFWTEVFETHRRVTDPEKKPKTEKQIRKWLRDPQTDAAEYKMWGNGVALPCVFFVMAGIAWADASGL